MKKIFGAIGGIILAIIGTVITPRLTTLTEDYVSAIELSANDSVEVRKVAPWESIDKRVKKEICLQTSTFDVLIDIQRSSELTALQIEALGAIVSYCMENLNNFDNLGAAEHFRFDTCYELAVSLDKHYETNKTYLAYRSPVIQSESGTEIIYSLHELKTGIVWIINYRLDTGDYTITPNDRSVNDYEKHQLR